MEEKKFALLIDADNISAKYIKIIIDELGKYGTITYKRLYGDLSRTNNRSWKNALLSHSINPVQQYNYTTGKNSTDSAMIIDAMDILYSGRVDGFCLASSDSDFTRLASRLRESGKIIIGMGEKKTPDSFRSACTIFTELENLLENENSSNGTDKQAIEETIINIITQNDNKGKVTGSGEIGSKLQNKYPDFDIRTFGYTQLSKFLEDIPAIVLNKESSLITVSLRDEKNEEDSTIQDIREIVRRRGSRGIALATLGLEIRRRHRGFNVKLYGYSQLYRFIESIPDLEVIGDRADRKVVYRAKN